MQVALLFTASIDRTGNLSLHTIFLSLSLRDAGVRGVLPHPICGAGGAQHPAEETRLCEDALRHGHLLTCSVLLLLGNGRNYL